MATLDMSRIQVKIDRAEAHLRDAGVIARRVEQACRDAVTAERDEHRFQYHFRIGNVPRIPSEFSAIIGDAIHNTRTVLDHLAWETVKALGKDPVAGSGGGTFFPIWYESRKTLPDIVPGVPDELRRVLDSVQPYKGGEPADHPLTVLHKLDISDKHHQLLTTILGLNLADWWDDVTDFIHFNAGPYEPGDVVAWCDYLDTGRKTKFDPYFAFAVSLSEPAAGGYRHILPADDLITDCLRYVTKEVIPRFTACLSNLP
jgi:hypothetical protein